MAVIILMILAIMAGKRILVELTLEKKVSLIKDNASGKSQRKLGDMYGVSKTTVSNILNIKS